MSSSSSSPLPRLLLLPFLPRFALAAEVLVVVLFFFFLLDEEDDDEAARFFLLFHVHS